MFSLRHATHSARKYAPRLELLECRAVPTLFAVGTAPLASSLGEAAASIDYPTDQGPMMSVTLDARAFPVGQGQHDGSYLILGTADTALQIKTAPDKGQQEGDPATVALGFDYTAFLQSFYGYPPPWTSLVSYIARVDTAEFGQELFEGTISTDATSGDRIADQGTVLIPISIGEDVVISLQVYGEAHAASMHYQDEDGFHAEITLQDAPTAPGVAPGLRGVSADFLGEAPRPVPHGLNVEGTHADPAVRDNLPLTIGSNRYAANEPGSSPRTSFGSQATGRISGSRLPADVEGHRLDLF